MTALARVDAVDQVRHHLNQADREGRPRPGRPTLVKLTNLTDYAVKTALDRIKEDETTSTGDLAAPPPADAREHQDPGGSASYRDANAQDHQPGETSTDTWRSPATAGDPPAPAADTPEHRQVQPPAPADITRPPTSSNSTHQDVTSAGEDHQQTTPASSTGEPATLPHAMAATPPGGTGPGAGATPSPTMTPPAHQPGAVQGPPAPAITSSEHHQPPAGDSALATPPADTTNSPAASHQPATNTSGLMVSWTGFIFGSIMSIAANVLHTWLPAATQPAGWTPGIAPQIGAAVWPIGLLLSVEILSRVQWPHTWPWMLARYGGAGTVAIGSAIISYGHAHNLLLAWHYDPLAATVGPFVLDGLMTISGFALLTTKHTDVGSVAASARIS